MKTSARAAIALVSAASMMGCAALVGLDHEYEQSEAGTAAAGGGSGTGSSGSGAGGTDVVVCTPGATEACYGGPTNTMGVGACKAGERTCNAAGDGFDACIGEVLPAAEDCSTAGIDDDCDGAELIEPGKPYDADSGCICAPGSLVSCYSGPAGTAGVGSCKEGTATCAADGKSTMGCSGEVVPQLDDCVTQADEDCDGAAALCSLTAEWSKRAGNGQDQGGFAIAADANDNVVTGGSFQGTIDLGGGVFSAMQGADAYIAKYSAAGAHQWSHRFASGGDDIVVDIAVDMAGNIIAVGTFEGGSVDFGGGAIVSKGNIDAFVAKLDPAGNHLWSVGLGGADIQRATSVAVAPNGDVYVCGHFKGTPDFGQGPLANGGATDFFLVKLASASGATLWSKGFGDSSNQTAIYVASDIGGNALLTGALAGVVSFGPIPLVAQGADVFVAKFTPTGVHAWSQTFGDSSIQFGQDIVTDGTDMLVSGQFQGAVDFGSGAMAAASTDVFVAKLDTNGMPLWSKGFGGANDQTGGRLALGAASAVIVTGAFSNSIDFGPGSIPVNGGVSDAFVLKLNAAGGYVMSRTIVGSGQQSVVDVATDTKGSILVTGGFENMLDLGLGNTHASAGGYDIFIAKLAQ